MSYLHQATEYLKSQGINPMAGVPAPIGDNILPMRKAFPIAMHYANAMQAQDITEDQEDDFQI